MSGGSYPRNDGLMRVLTILRLLEARGRYRVDTLAEQFGVHVRTIRRDLEALQRVGYPITYEDRDDGRRYWWLVRR